MNSEIFDNYVKIMTDKGFVKEADVMTQEDKESDKDYKEKIQALYGNEIKTNDSTKNIIEQAHPEKVIIAPAYDRLNGLVENINERHDIMVGIVNRKPKGMHTQHRYAKKELLDELVRLGFQLDNDGEEEFSKMADECANGIVKQAFWPGLVAALPWIAKALVGISTVGYIKSQVIGHISQGIKPDAEKAISALQELKQSVSPANYGLIDKWTKALQMLYQNSQKAENIAGNTENQNVDIDVNLDQNKLAATREDLAFLNKFKDMATYVASKIGATGVSDTGFLAQIKEMEEGGEAESEWWQMAEGAWESVFGGAKSNAINSLAALRNSLQAFVQKLSEASTEGRATAEQKQEDIKNVLEEKAGGGEDTSEYVKEE